MRPIRFRRLSFRAAKSALACSGAESASAAVSGPGKRLRSLTASRDTPSAVSPPSRPFKRTMVWNAVLSLCSRQPSKS